MRPVQEIVDIFANKFPDYDVYTDSIPAEVLDDTDKTQVLIMESESSNDLHANNTFNGLLIGYDIQIFYSLEFLNNIFEAEVNLMKNLEQKRWTINDSQRHYNDPITGQTIKNITVNKIYELDEIAN
jgi:hypothetical protein